MNIEGGIIMKLADLKAIYINEVYDGNRGAYLRDRRRDYCAAQLRWSCWIDSLCKDGVITQAQYDRATF